MRLTRLLVVACAAGLVLGSAARAATVPNPSVQELDGGVHGYPWNHSLIALDQPAHPYTEREYRFGGTATDLSNGAQAPYQSRMLVRLPQDPHAFNGTVIVEWLNVTSQEDLESAWPVEGQYLMDHGYGFVGVSAQLAGVCCGPTTLKGWDPVRYSLLVHPGDRFSQDIFSQAIRALRDPDDNRAGLTGAPPVDPMRGMSISHLVVTGASQSAQQLTTFVNGGYNRGQVDAYVITRGGGPFTDLSTPVFQLNEESQPAQPPDGEHYRLWEEAGTAHAPYVWWGYVWAEDERDLAANGVPDPVDTACSVNRGSVDYSTRALTWWVQRYLDDGLMPPSMPRLERDANGVVLRDADGLARGGVRQPFVEVPVALNRAAGTQGIGANRVVVSGEQDCTLFGLYRPWSKAKITARYATHGAYVGDVAEAAAHDVAAGWLLPADGQDAVERARRFGGPWTQGSCYDTSTPTADESGPVSSQVAPASEDPRLPLGGQRAVREADCSLIASNGG